MRKNFMGFLVCLLTTLILTMATGCSVEEPLSSEEVIKLLESESPSDITSFYQESESSTYVNNQVIHQEKTKHWQDLVSGKARYEFSDKNDSKRYTVFDGEKQTLYWENENRALIMDAPQKPPYQNTGALKEEILKFLNRLSGTHFIELKGKEDVNGISTYHIVAKVKDPEALQGDQEYWLDPNTWYFVKIISENGNERQETVIKKLEINPELPKDLFTIELPEGTDISYEQKTEVLTLEQARAYLGKSFYYFEGTDKVKQMPIQKGMNNDNEDQDNKSLIIMYMKEEKTYFTIFINEISEDMDILTGDEILKVHNQDGYISNDQNGHVVTWEENGLRYIVRDFNNLLDKEELIEIVSNLKGRE